MFYLGNNQFRIILGEACNMNCLYCGQVINPNKDKPKEISQNFYDYFKWLVNTSDDKAIYRIQFFGGEPLLYWDKIVTITEYLQSLDKTKFSFYMTTNGLLLTDDIVEWCNANDVAVCFSWDGRASAITRKYDVLNDKLDLFLKLNKVALSGVLTAKSYVADILEDWDKIFYERVNIINPCMSTNLIYMCDLNWAAPELKNFDYDKMSEQYTKVYDIYREYIKLQNIQEKQEYLQKHYLTIRYAEEYIKSINQSFDDKTLKNSFCELVIGALPMDLDCNIYTCSQVMDKPLANLVTDTSQYIINSYAQSELGIMNRRNTICKDCEADPICKGACKLIDDKNLDMTCDLYKHVIQYLYREILQTEQLIKQINN